MSAGKTKLAVVGAGYWGPNLIRNVAMSGRGELAWVCDLDEARRARIAAQYPETQTTANLDDVLADENVSGVVLATPAETHVDLGMRILDAGKHVLIEKPLAMDVAGARRLVEKAEADDLVLLVGHLFEYNAAVLKMRELIDAGEIGDVFYLYSQRVNLGRIRTDCNAMWNLAPHDISIADFLIGESPVWARATGYCFLDSPLEDVVFLTIGYPGEKVAHIHVSWLDPNKIRRTTIVGSKKMLVYDDMSNDAKVRVFDKGVSKVSVRPDDAEAPPFGEFQFHTRSGDVWIPKINFVEPLRAEVAHFLACIAGEETPRTDGRNGLDVVQVLEAGQKSLERGGERVEIES